MELYNIGEVSRDTLIDINKVLKFIDKQDLFKYTIGSHEIDNEIKFNVISYKSDTPESRSWESHRKFLDVHVPLKGYEKIEHNFIKNMNITNYNIEEDSVVMSGVKKSEIVISKGDILILGENDAHKTGLTAGKIEQIHKVVFKVAL